MTPRAQRSQRRRSQSARQLRGAIEPVPGARLGLVQGNADPGRHGARQHRAQLVEQDDIL
jgi:hypothetical protein